MASSIKSSTAVKSDREPQIGDDAGQAHGPLKAFSGLTLFDFCFLLTLLILTYPLLKLARLPFSFDLATLSKGYWLMPIGGIFVAVLIAVVTMPRLSLLPFLIRLRAKKGLILVLLAAAALLTAILGPGMGMVILVDAVALAELSQHFHHKFESKLLDVLIPGVYLFLGLLAIFAFNHAIVGIRYGGTYDGTLDWLDHLLFHANVSAIAHWGFTHLPSWVYDVLDFMYFSIWSRIGAGFILIALLNGRDNAIKFVRNALICYVIALSIFAMFPGKGPYSICPQRAALYPKSLQSYDTQRVLVERIKKLYSHTLTDDVREVGVGDYYISFPSLHAALPIIVLWSIRRWKRIQALLLLSYVLFLLPALVLLEWHYLVDIMGGWGVAMLSIWITEKTAGTFAKHIPGQPRPCVLP
ncbi:MAG: phosphatase PAP2 family protein [Acidobacteriota bacterium]|nr:phosphatase PAP2 family protein [Acidobacteriota bacterium]